MTAANVATTISDGGSGAGEFKVNGVSIAFNSSTESIAEVLARINNSAAGVTASYDNINDRFVLQNKATGDVGMALEDVTGNFLAATKLDSGALTRGKDLRYTLNGGDELTSHSNTITDASSGVTGLSVAVLKEGAVSVRVEGDTAKIKTAITDFLAEYNKAQALIDSQTTSTTDAKGKVTANVLTGDTLAADIAKALRSKAFTPLTGLSGSLDHLADIGITTSGTDNSLTLSDSEKLATALTDNLASVKELFTNTTNGLAVQLSSFLDTTIGDEGSVVNRQNGLTKEAGSIDTQIADAERVVLATRDRLINSFLAMETAQANSNQQLQFLQKRFA
jgi:flagellar hook-associated protein 2